jgi:NAD(P)-dependent dehydrogenase (short-subunit alcohol dehydrogenase family)|tara:strand:+ start:360 stop:1115 length:756 start_codon:yes stop_codon:yes gene_type:complete
LTELTGKRALVTGSKSGIGFAIAKRLVQAGAEIILHARNDSSEVEAAKIKLAKLANEDISTVFGDFSDPNSCCSLFEAIKKESKPIDILVNNAAIQPVCALADLGPSEISQMLETNLQVPIMMTRYFAEYSENGGSIVNICSIEGLTPAINHSHYAASKAGLINFTKASALELGSKNIRVNSICPGLTDRQNLDKDWPQGVQNWLENVPLKRLGTGEDIANATLFLVSDAASFITGANLIVDGGMECVPSW